MAATMPQDFEPDLSGYVLDRYRLLRCLGVGGMGAVYEAEHTALGKRVAVKLLRQQFSMHELSRKRFLREARAATRVEHPHVVDISDFGETSDGRVYFVMELLAGRDLGQLLDAELRLPWSRAQDLLVQIVSALGAAHAHGIVHRDMKPSNCFLVDVPGIEGRDFIKVLDFGIAKLSGKHGEETQGLTSTDEVFGTVGYMAPEMAMGISDEPRSDVYAVGVMMYRMLVGELPFEGGTAFQILARHVGEQPILPRTKNPAISEGVERIILRAMAKRPEDRFASMQELGDAIRRGDVDAGASSSRSLVDGTMRMDSGQSLGRMTLERTASLAMGGIDTGPWASVGSAGHTEVMVGRGGDTSRPHSRSVRVKAMETANSRRVVEEGYDGYHDDDDHVDLDPATRGGAKRRVLVVAGALLGMTAILVGVALLLAPPDRPAAHPVAIIPSRAPAEAPARVATPNPFATPEPEPPVPQSTLEQHAVEPSEPELEEPESEPPVEPEPVPLNGRTHKPRPPKTDAFVAARTHDKIVARCRIDGSATVKIEGIIGTGGKVLSPIVTPAQGRGSCARKVVKATVFAPGQEMRTMPVLSVDL